MSGDETQNARASSQDTDNESNADHGTLRIAGIDNDQTLPWLILESIVLCCSVAF
ncbi:MAG: hypothetical protein ACK50J_30970 [Planctomyces sp.]|jgi:hypothetical protein